MTDHPSPSPLFGRLQGAAMIAALRMWARASALTRPELLKVGYLASTGLHKQSGTGLAVVLVVSERPVGSGDAPVDWGIRAVAGRADVIVYTEAEWRRLPPGRAQREVVWVFER